MQTKAQVNRYSRRNEHGKFTPTTGLDRALNRVRMGVTITPAMRIALESMALESGRSLSRQVEAMLARQIDETMAREIRQ